MHVVEVGFACNNACVFCAQGALREREPARSVLELERLVDTAPVDETIAFVGGEPLLCEALPELVRRARDRGVPGVLVQTNARQLALGGIADHLVEAGVTGLDVSLHGSSVAMHDYHTGIAGSFRQTVAGLRRARAARLAIATTTVITRSNYRHLCDVVRIAHSLGARAVRLLAALPLGRAAQAAPRVVPAAGLARPALGRAVELAQSLDLGVVTDDTAMPAAASARFAPLASVERRPIARPFAPSPATVSCDPGLLSAREARVARAVPAAASAFEG